MNNNINLQTSECPFAVARLNHTFQVVATNVALCDLLGVSSDQLLNTSIVELFSPNDQAVIASAITALSSAHQQAVKLGSFKLANRDAWVTLHIVADAAAHGTAQQSYTAYLADVTESSHADKLIETMSMNLALMQGDAFFVNVSKYICEKLGYEYAFVGGLVDSTRIKLLGGVGEGKVLESFEYLLEDSPCENVVGRKVCVYPYSVQAQFPKDHMLQEMGIESYLGSPIFDSKGNPLGIIVILGKKPITNEKLAKATISIFSERVSAELERIKAQDLLTYQASHDSLCDVLNRRAFQNEVGNTLKMAQLNQTEHALLYIDLDQFKVVNDTCGHVAGDELLKQIALLLRESLDDTALLGRLGSDEFGILLNNCTLNSAKAFAEDLLAKVHEFAFIWQGRTFNTAMSIGVTQVTAQVKNKEALFKQADTASFLAKNKGRNNYHVYQENDIAISSHESQLLWVSDISTSLREDGFTLYAQQISKASEDKANLNHYEILIRKWDKSGNIIMPGAFLAAAERYNLICEIDEWVIKQCFKLLSAHPNFLATTDFIAINLSGQSVTSESILTLIQNQLLAHDVPANKLCFEVTETAAIARLSEARKFINELRSLGCRFALDDFGTGLSSLSYLKHLPVDYLKIDGMFVKGIVDDPIDRAMVKAINEMGQVMGMQTIAEFVENDEIKTILSEIGVDYMQGYGIAKPEPLEKFLSQDSLNAKSA